MTDSTNNLKLILLEQNQSQKEININESIIKIDGILNTMIKEKNVLTEPQSPEIGLLYALSKNIEEDDPWFSYSGQLAFYTINGWRFIKPNKGLILWSDEDESINVYNGLEWLTV